MAEAMALFGALLGGQMPARVPVAVNMLDQGAKALGMSIREYYASADHVVDGQLALQKRFGHDVCWGFHYTATIAEMLGSRHTIFATDGPPNVGQLVIRDVADIDAFDVAVDLENHPAFAIQAETIRKLNEALGGSVPVCVAVMGSFTLPSILMGMERWLELLMMGPRSAVDQLLEKCSDFTIRLFKAFINAGAHLVTYSNPCASIDFLPLKQIEALAMPWIERDVVGCGSQGFVYFSGGGRIGPTLPMLKKNTTIGVYYIHPHDDIARAKADCQGQAIVAASINDIPLVRYSPKQVRAEVARIMAAGRDGGGFIFGTNVMPYGIPDENIHAMIEAAHQFGDYGEMS